MLRREIIATVTVNYLVNRGGVTLLPRLTGVAEFALGDAVAAWVEVDRAAEAEALREVVLGAGRSASEEHAALVEIEDALETAVRQRLSGGKGRGAAAALRSIRKRLGV